MGVHHTVTTMRIPLVSWLSMVLCCFWIFLSFNISIVFSGHCLEHQKSLLLQLKNSLTFNELSSTKLVSWNQNLTCCDWIGVPCDEEGHVTGLDLSGESISGGFNSSSTIFSFQYLQSLNLASNNFNSTIPHEFYKLKKLTYLNLSYAGFVGQIPKEISLLTRLVTLDISSLPHLLRPELKLENPNLRMLVQNLTSIRQLYLDGVTISAQGQEWSNALLSMPNLQELSMSGCNLSGSFDSSLARLKHLSVIRLQQALTYLDLSKNNIEGIIPNWIWKLENLAYLNLSYNVLTDLEIPPQNLSSKLVLLDLHSNKLRGPISVFPRYAAYLDYSNNKFTSIIPDDIGDYLSVTIFLSLSNNSFHGVIPKSICNVSNLQVLDLSHNNLSGRIPSCLMTMSDTLGVLTLRKNNLRGQIPDKFPASCALRTLDLHGNHLDGPMPKSLANCKTIEVLDLGKNHFIDGFPCLLKNISTLLVLVLRQNKFYGSIGCPNTSDIWEKLHIADLAFNNFTGKLAGKFFRSWEGMMPDEATTLQFEILDFGDIYYQDKVIVTRKGREINLVKILTVFSAIDLSSNHLEGSIPEEMMNFKALCILNLSNNALTGQLPSSIGNLRNLESLDLSHNSLGGEIPMEITLLPFLSLLNVSFNQLEGKIPLGGQIVTFTESSFIDNKALCGPPLTQSCNENGGGVVIMSRSQPTKSPTNWDFIIPELGFTFGIVTFTWALVFWKPWRIWYWKQVDDMLYRIFPRHLDFQYEYRGGQLYRTLRWKTY